MFLTLEQHVGYQLFVLVVEFFICLTIYKERICFNKLRCYVNFKIKLLCYNENRSLRRIKLTYRYMIKSLSFNDHLV